MPDYSAWIGSFLDVYIDAKDLTRENPCLEERRLWGNTIYTDDSDVVLGKLWADDPKHPPVHMVKMSV